MTFPNTTLHPASQTPWLKLVRNVTVLAEYVLLSYCWASKVCPDFLHVLSKLVYNLEI